MYLFYPQNLILEWLAYLFFETKYKWLCADTVAFGVAWKEKKMCMLA